MLESGITYADLLKRETELGSFYTTSELTQFLKDAKIQLEDIIKNRGQKLKNLCKRLSLTNAIKSEEDLIERLRLVVTASGVSGSFTVAFEGTNDDSSETYSTITPDTTLSFVTNTTISTLFHDSYRFYKLTKTGTGTISAYLVETSFELCHAYLALMLAYKSLVALNGDTWEGKSKEYESKFELAAQHMNYSYDEDEDGEAGDEENSVHQVTWVR